MKYILAIIVGLVLASFLVWFFLEDADVSPVRQGGNNGPDITTRVDTAYGLSYTYRTDEYRVYENTQDVSGDVVYSISLLDVDDFDNLISTTVPREESVGLSVQVYRNPLNLETREWITKTSASNYSLSPDGTIRETQLGDTQFLAYQFDGLYRADAYVVGQNGFVYVFFNMWENPESAMKKDMEAVVASLRLGDPTIPASVAHGDIVLQTPDIGAEISSRVVLEGKARGGWYFEATFPVIVVDWDGRIVGEGYAEALGDWMTEDFVPFRGTVSFEKPEWNTRGSLILKKSNASGLPQHDDAIEVPIQFK